MWAGGQRLLVNGSVLLAYSDITVLDIAASALEHTRRCLSAKATGVHWPVADIRNFQPQGTNDLWHDLTSFHFLTAEQNVNYYAQQAEKHIAPGGSLVLAVFPMKDQNRAAGWPFAGTVRSICRTICTCFLES